MDCQLNELPDAGQPLSRLDKLRDRARNRFRYLTRNTRRVITDPGVLLDKLGLRSSEPPAAPSEQARCRPAPLGLRPGDRVRVKSREDIEATLADGRCAGLAFMAIQERFCGGEFTVHKRIERFFDERTRRMLKVRDIVILDEVYCEPPRDGYQDYAGCDRTCFLFWKEAWLERV